MSEYVATLPNCSGMEDIYHSSWIHSSGDHSKPHEKDKHEWRVNRILGMLIQTLAYIPALRQQRLH